MGCGCDGEVGVWPEEPCGVVLTDLATAMLNPLMGAAQGMCYFPTLCPPPPAWPGYRPPTPEPHYPPGRPQPLAWVPNIQCRDSSISANTWCHPWQTPTIPTCAIIASTRNGVPCRCCCPPHRCMGKLATFYR